eukprot:TRINITY_DN24584_c0_g1_i8.p1 TRINITY_DN24584_c0_g1~~TRINITY_DN24584_c0_g1_i8.p1  ORF type:complete len:731 (+),score=226.56 TRINITY_DN24584_c0_g1_i8:37-2193(+)
MPAGSVFDTFRGFCSLCEQISGEGAHTVKTEIMKGYLAKYTGDKVVLYKMLLPKLSGRKYYMQDKQLVTIFARVMGADEKDLREKVNKSGDLSETLKAEGAGRLDRSAMSISEADERLTALSKVTTEVKQQAELEKLVKSCSNDDIKWFVRIIKLDLRLGAGVKCLLDALSQDAYQLYKTLSSLEKVIHKVAGTDSPANDTDAPSDSPPPTGLGLIQLHTPVSPQLARAAQSIDDVVKRCPNTFFSEVKYDGERIQIHKENSEFTFWSRSLKPMKEDKYEGLEKHLYEAFASMQQCVWDGEILLVDKKTGIPLPFGSQGKHKKAGFKDACTCIFLFDVLQVNGTIVMDKPIEERRTIMNTHCKVITNRVMLSEMIHIKGDKDEMHNMLRRHLKMAISRGLEGLVLKDIKSPYAPGSRKWIKLKKDYLKGMADTSDLVVLGANWGTGTLGGLLSVFLMGCYDPETQSWKTVCKVGNGHDDVTIKQLTNDLKPTMEAAVKGSPPAWLDIHPHNTPAFYVKDPKNAPVWEVVGAEFTKSLTHTADSISVRFPRVISIRADKTWKEATSLPQLRAIVTASREVAMMKLPSVLEEGIRDEDENDERADDMPADAPSPQIRLDADPQPMEVDPPAEPEPEAEPAPKLKGSLQYCCGEAVRLVDTQTSMIRIIAHCVAKSSKWSTKGAMGQISRVLGDEPQEQYDEASGTLTLGEDVHVICTNKC